MAAFEYRQAEEIRDAFIRHGARHLFIGKSGAILLGYPDTTQDADLFVEKDPANGRAILAALVDLGFSLTDAQREEILRGKDLVQLKNGPFDLDLIFAPDGIERFEDLKSWQEARRLTQIVYRLTNGGVFSRDRALCRQVQEAAVSSMGNVAEAHGRYSFEDKRRLLDIALGSCKEVQSHLYVALDQAYVGKEGFDETYRQADAVAQLIAGSVNNLDRQIAKRSPDKRGPRGRVR